MKPIPRQRKWVTRITWCADKETVRFPIKGPPRTKKTGQRIVWAGRRPRILPSKAHDAWYVVTRSQALRIKVELRDAGIELPITAPVTVQATFLRDRAYKADECGYMQALGDWLEGVGIIENDHQIHWGGVCLDKDAGDPRIEVEIRR